MVAHRRMADEQALADLLVSHPFANKSDDFAFPLGQFGDLDTLGVGLVPSYLTRALRYAHLLTIMDPLTRSAVEGFSIHPSH